MIVKSDKSFTPIVVSITLETKQEFSDFKEMIRFNDSIPEMLRKEEARCDSRKCGNMLSQIYNQLDK